MTRYCKDCEYCSGGKWCHYFRLTETRRNLVTGEVLHHGAHDCIWMRYGDRDPYERRPVGADGQCGIVGRFFKPKESDDEKHSD